MNYFPFMKYKWLYFGISLLVLVPGIYSLLRFGLRFSIDFTGGSLLEIQTQAPTSTSTISQAVSSSQVEVVSVQPASDNVYLLRLKPIDQQTGDHLVSLLDQQLSGVTSRSLETVGPTIGAQLSRRAAAAVGLASVFIVLYIAWSFRHIPRPYSSLKFGLCAVAALIHDTILVIGLFSLFGHFYHVEIDALFVTALLTVIGFSVHDSIVVFDRIRENLTKHSPMSFTQIVDISLTETLTRSLSTTFTVVLTLTALLLFGGETIHWFTVALLVGIVSGTYSSIFNAAPLLALWEARERK